MAQTRRWRSNARREDGGFALLLAMLGGLALLLSSLSVQTTALQSRASMQRLVLRRQQEDALVSATQLVAGQLRQRSCLLPLPLSQWSGAGAAACGTAATRQSLIEGSLPGADAAAGKFRVVDYQPVAPPQKPDGDSQQAPWLAGELEVEWLPAAGGAVRRRIRLEPIAMAAPPEPPTPQGP